MDEVRIISRICPFLKVVILPGGQFAIGEEGSVIHFPFPSTTSDASSASSIERVGSHPIMCWTIPARDISNYAGTNQPGRCASDQALTWLRVNNALYTGISLQGKSNTDES